MLNLFAATGHSNYAKSARLYLQMMKKLPTNHHKTSNQHAELGASQIKRDNDDLEKTKLWIENHNPFDDNEPLLRSIATGLTATEGDGINCDEAEKIGQAIQDQLDGISITEATIKKKDQIKTLELLRWELK